MAQLLITTPASTAHALDVNGHPLTGAHEQITGILRGRLGAKYAHLLATPKLAADGAIAWSTPLAGAVLRAGDLAEETREKLVQRHDRLNAEIRALAEQFRGEAAATSNTVANMLELALQQPPGDWLFSVDGKPVLAMWGHAATVPRSADVAPAAALTVAAAAAAPVGTAAGPYGRLGAWPLLAATLGAAALVAVLWLRRESPAPVIALAPAVVQLPPEAPPAKAPVPVPAPTPEAPPASTPPPLPPAPEPLPEPVPDTPPAPATPPVHEPHAAPKPTRGGPLETRGHKAQERIQIPRGALHRGDLSFLEGLWQLGADHLGTYDDDPNEKTGSNRIVLEFGRDGRGTNHIVEREHHGRALRDCISGLTARTDGTKLYFKRDDCPSDDYSAMGSRHECLIDTNGQTMCYGINEDGVRWGAVRFAHRLMKIPRHRLQLPQQRRQVLKSSRNQVLHVPLALPGTVDRQQP